MRTMPSVLVMLLVLSACGREGALVAAHPQVSDHAAIYAGVISKTARRGYAYVERPIRGPADPNDVRKVIGPPRLTDDLCDEIRRALEDRPGFGCVAGDATGLVGPSAEGSAVINNRYIISLGAIVGVDDFPGTVHVNVKYYCANLCGGEMTWVVERVVGEWTVTGTTGPVAVS